MEVKAVIYVLLALISVFGFTSSTHDKSTLPYCQIMQISPCFNQAIRSYTAATRGEEAAAGPVNLDDANKVSFALNEDVSAPWVDDVLMNQLCEVINKTDLVAFSYCVEFKSTMCRTDFPQDEDIVENTLPSLRYMDLVQSGRIHGKVCNIDCMENNYTLEARFVNLKACWKPYKDMIEAVRTGNTSMADCSVLDHYLQCQWNNSLGCEYLELATQNHAIHMMGVIGDVCNITLPPEALVDPFPPPTTTTKAPTTTTVVAPTTTENNTGAGGSGDKDDDNTINGTSTVVQTLSATQLVLLMTGATAFQYEWIL